MGLPIPEVEAQIEKWNLIDAYKNYLNNCKLERGNEPDWMQPEIDFQYYTQEGFNLKIKSNSEFSKKWYTKTWWDNLERVDLTEEELKELNDLTSYDQMLNTVGRGVQCNDCGKLEAELYKKYYP